MKGEIDRDFYCSAGYFDKAEGGICKDPCGIGIKCRIPCMFHKHKWPTPDQYEEEYCEEYPETGAVYTRSRTPQGKAGNWYCAVLGLKDALNTKFTGIQTQIVCACTPWGKPPADWRPE
jgi:hypothetical protein